MTLITTYYDFLKIIWLVMCKESGQQFVLKSCVIWTAKAQS